VLAVAFDEAGNCTRHHRVRIEQSGWGKRPRRDRRGRRPPRPPGARRSGRRRRGESFPGGMLRPAACAVASPTGRAAGKFSAGCCKRDKDGSDDPTRGGVDERAAATVARHAARRPTTGPMAACRGAGDVIGQAQGRPPPRQGTQSVVPQSRGLPQKEGSSGRLSRSRDTRYGTRGPGSRADRNAKTSRHGLLAGDDGASNRRRPSSQKSGNRRLGPISPNGN